MCEYSINPFMQQNILDTPVLQSFSHSNTREFHRTLAGYKFTPLISLNNLAKALKVGQIDVKDESQRLDLKAFKIMGASYAIYCLIKEKWEQAFGVQFDINNLYKPELLKQLQLPPFCTATDGNHGRAVAWFSRMIDNKAVIYMPINSVKARIENIRNEKAEVIVVDGNYDLAVKQAAEDAEKFGWQIISDTSYPGYFEIPSLIMTGYRTIFQEIGDDKNYDLIILQGGVGSFAASAALYFRNNARYKNCKLVVVEPISADCLLESIKSTNGELTISTKEQSSIMAGLNCGTPSVIAWPILKDNIDLFLSISDDYAKKAMRQFYHPIDGDQKIISGESGAAGLGALLAILNNNELTKVKEYLNLNMKSKILLFNTEGDTDPENFKKIVNS